MSNSMADVAGFAQAMLIIGSNTTEQHPVFGAMIRQAVLKRDVKLVVADPRRIDITEFATLHIRQRPGTDVALVNGLMHIILRKAGKIKPSFPAAPRVRNSGSSSSIHLKSSAITASRPNSSTRPLKSWRPTSPWL
jgi:anaerobic selenocysteine-containing dehydrogenase